MVGPPTTVGCVLSRGRESTDEERLFTPYFRFVGDTTPEREVVATACFVAELWSSVASKSDVVLIDTCGLFSYPAGYWLKMLKIRLVHPEMVVAIGEEEEFSFWRQCLGERLMVLPLPRGVTQKYYELRRSHRKRLFARYFARGKYVRLPLSALRFSLPCYPSFFMLALVEEGSRIIFRVRGRRWIVSEGEIATLQEEESDRELDLSCALCGIYSGEGKDLGLGIMKRFFRETREIEIFAVFVNPGRPEIVIPGCLRVTEEGEERGRFPFFPSTCL